MHNPAFQWQEWENNGPSIRWQMSYSAGDGPVGVVNTHSNAMIEFAYSVVPPLSSPPPKIRRVRRRVTAHEKDCACHQCIEAELAIESTVIECEADETADDLTVYEDSDQ